MQVVAHLCQDSYQPFQSFLRKQEFAGQSYVSLDILEEILYFARLATFACVAIISRSCTSTTNLT
jgi:hypothetical protein